MMNRKKIVLLLCAAMLLAGCAERKVEVDAGLFNQTPAPVFTAVPMPTAVPVPTMEGTLFENAEIKYTLRLLPGWVRTALPDNDDAKLDMLTKTDAGGNVSGAAIIAHIPGVEVQDMVDNIDAFTAAMPGLMGQNGDNLHFEASVNETARISSYDANYVAFNIYDKGKNNEFAGTYHLYLIPGSQDSLYFLFTIQFAGSANANSYSEAMEMLGTLTISG